MLPCILAKAQAPGNTPTLTTYSMNLPFAIDGHVLRQATGAGSPGDWTTTTALFPTGAVFHPVTGQGSPYPFTLTRHVVDAYNANDNIFASGAKANDNPNTQWNWTTGSAGNKEDVNNALIHVAKDAAGNTWVLLGGDRLSQNGTSYIDFEFLQQTMTIQAGGSFSTLASNATGGRTPGDFLVTMEYVNGGSVPNIFYYKWQLTSGGNYDWVSFTPTTGTNYGATNGVATSVPYGAFGSTSYPVNAFVEAAINATALVGLANINPCTGLAFQTLFIKTKASNSASAVLKDLIDPVQLSQYTQLTATATATPIQCFGGNGVITVNAAGGSGSYSYSLNGGAFQAANTFSVPAGGPYTITVQDANGCSAVASSVVLSQPAALTASLAGQNNVACFGNATGTAAVSAGGGTPPYAYSWNTVPVQTTATATGLAAGSYTATVTDANGCMKTVPVTITQPAAAVQATIGNFVHVSCFGGNNGSATVNATGGTAPYAYSWNTVPVQTTATVTDLSAGSYTVTVTDAAGCVTTQSTQITQPAALLAAIGSATPVSCFGQSNGSAAAAISGGTPPYTYSWNTVPLQTTAGVNNLTAGNYTVTVTDSKGCQDTANIVITQPQPLTAAVNATPLSCFGASNGTASAAVSGGTGPYSYSWNTTPAQTGSSVSGLPAGAFTVTVTDANGCTATATATVSYPYQPLTAAAYGTPVSCFGGSNGAAAATVSGGLPPYTYTWNTTPAQTGSAATGLIAGSYTVVVADANGCVDTATVQISQPAAALSLAITGSSNVSCFGGVNGSATALAAGGTAPYVYQWSSAPVQTGTAAGSLGAGTYTVTVSDNNGCTAAQSIVITEPGPLSAQITAADNPSCFGFSNGSATATATGGTLPYSYAWNTAPPQAAATATGLPAGSYTATITDGNGCIAAATVTLGQPQPLVLATTATNLSCPGANDGTASVAATGGTAPYSISWNTIPAATTGSLTNLPQGSYTATVTDAQGCTASATVSVSYPYDSLQAEPGILTHVSCFGGTDGTGSVLASGGLPPYTYSWNTSPAQTGSTATGLPAGTYTVTVTDANGCTDTAVLLINQPAAPVSVQLTVNNISCHGTSTGSVASQATGGTPPYSYSWNTVPVQTGASISAVPAGTYTLTVTDAQGCPATVTATVTEPAALLASATVTGNPSCAGFQNGTAGAAVTGGNSPYSYHWNTSPAQTGSIATGLGAGTYTVTVTDANGCFDTGTVMLVEPLPLSVIATANPLACVSSANGSVTALGSGGTHPYSYSWNTMPVQNTATASSLPAGTYTVTLTDASGCTDTASATISYPYPPLDAVPGNTAPVSCHGGNNGSGSVVVTGGAAPYTYSWNTMPVQNTATATGLTAGTWIVSVSDANGCIDTAMVTITEPAAPLMLTTSASGATCFGTATGTASVTASGGTAPYTYSWNTTPVQTTSTANQLAAGVYTVTVTDAAACQSVSTVTISQPLALDAVVASAVQPACHGDANGSATAIATGGTAPYAYSWSTVPQQTTATATGLSSGSYTVRVTDSLGCQDSAQVSLQQPAPVTVSAQADPLLCVSSMNGSVTAAGSGGTQPYTYVWSTVPAQSGATATSLGAGTYTVTMTDAHGCLDTASATISYPYPPLDALPGAATPASCFGGTNGSASVLVGGGVAPYTYSWNTSPVQTGMTATGLPAGVYTVTVMDANGCTDTAMVTVGQPATPVTATIISQTPPTCHSGSNGTATVLATGGTAPYTYYWLTTPPQTAATAIGLTSGAHTVVVTDSNGCTTSASLFLTQPDPLNPLIQSVTQAVCYGDSNGAVAVIVSGGTPSYTYSWNTMPQLTGPVATGLPAGTYTVTVTDSNGCTATTSGTVMQPMPITVVTTVLNPVCSGGAGSAQAVAAGGNLIYTYSWNTVPVQATSFAAGLQPGTYTVTVTDQFGCQAAAPATIDSAPPPVVVTATVLNDVSCFGSSNGTATALATGGTAPFSYLWNTVPPQTGNFASGLTAGSYTVIATDSLGCADTASVIINTPPALTLIVTELNGTCPGATDGSAVAIAGGGTPSYTYIWNTSPMQTGDTASGLGAGSWQVLVRDSLGCTATGAVTVSAFPAPDVDAGADKVVCPGESVMLEATGAVSYSWTPAGGLSCPVCPDTWASPADSTVYTVTGTDMNGCVDSDKVAVTVRKRGPVGVGPEQVICEGAAAALSAMGGTSYLWIPATGLDDPTSANPVASPDTTTEYTVIIYQEPCFTDTLKQTVKVYPMPTINLGPDHTGLAGTSFTIDPVVTNSVGIRWQPVSGLSCDTCYRQQIVLEVPITYTATVHNEIGCTATDEIKIDVRCDNSVVFVPNTFTPNGDGSNDRFYPMSGGLKSISLFRVYDRWGELLFEARNIAPNEVNWGWDGTYKGSQLKPDVYVWYLEATCLNDYHVFMKGDISLVR